MIALEIFGASISSPSSAATDAGRMAMIGVNPRLKTVNASGGFTLPQSTAMTSFFRYRPADAAAGPGEFISRSANRPSWRQKFHPVIADQRARSSNHALSCRRYRRGVDGVNAPTRQAPTDRTVPKTLCVGAMVPEGSRRLGKVRFRHLHWIWLAAVAHFRYLHRQGSPR